MSGQKALGRRYQWLGVKVCLISMTISFVMTDVTSLIVDSPFGKIRGELVPAPTKGQDYVLFRNIPYAKPPVGDLRFAKPQPHPKLDDVFDATSHKKIKCIQPTIMLNGEEQGEEDCLILNVFAKSVQPEKSLKKVIIFIHGGGFVTGASYEYPISQFVATHDVIGVTMNYRLGILGFLSTGDEASPGNYGLWDQYLAIRWVKDNIRAFGGDPLDITLSGVSAGATSVSYQTLSPVTRGLFTRACSLSATATTVSAEAINPQKHAFNLAKSLGCWDGDATQTLDQNYLLLACLRNLSVSEFTSFADFFSGEPNFVPTVDGDFVPKKPIHMLKNEAYLESIGFYDRSYFISILNNERAIVKVYMESVINAIRNHPQLDKNTKDHLVTSYVEKVGNNSVASRLGLNPDTPLSPKTTQNIIDFYSRRNTDEDVLVDLVGDLSFLIPSYDVLDAASKQSSRCKSWFLYFDYYPVVVMAGEFRGMLHGLDLLYWLDFDVNDLQKIFFTPLEKEMDHDDLKLKSLFSAVLAGFVKYGDPGSALKTQLPYGWPTYETCTSYYLNFNLAPTIRSHLGADRRDLWLEEVQKCSSKVLHTHTDL